MTGRLRESEVRLYGWFLIVVLKLIVVVGFHVWSVQVGRQGLAPVVIGGDDGEFYLYTAESIVQTGQYPEGLPNIWPIVVGWIMLHTGWGGTLPFKAILFVASIGTAVAGVRLLRLLALDLSHRPPGAGAEVTVAGLLLLFPSTVWIASYSIYRDAVIYFLALAAVLAAYRTFVRKERAYALVFAAVLAVLIAFRWYAALSVGAGVLLWMLLSGGHRRGRWKRRWLAVGVGVVAVAVVVVSGEEGFVIGALSSRDIYDYNQGGSNMGLSYTRSEIYLWPSIYIYTFITNLIGPLPNQIEGATTLIGFILEVPLLVFVLWRVARSPYRGRPERQLLLSVAFVWFALIAIYNDNVGTGLRLRVIGYQFLFVLAVLDVSMSRAQARVNRARAARVRAGRFEHAATRPLRPS